MGSAQLTPPSPPFLPPDSHHGQRRLHPHLREGDIDAVPTSPACHLVLHSLPVLPLSSARPQSLWHLPGPLLPRPHHLGLGW